MNTLRFSPADLEANREGHLSDAQRKKLDAEVDDLRQQSKSIRLVWAVAFGIALILGWIITPKPIYSLTFSIFVGNLALMLGIFPLLTVLTFGPLLIGTHLTIHEYTQKHTRLSIAEGEVQVLSINGKSQRYEVQLWHGWRRGSTFPFPDAESLNYFQSGKRYRIHYLSYNQPFVLSAEQLTDAKAKR